MRTAYVMYCASGSFANPRRGLWGMMTAARPLDSQEVPPVLNLTAGGVLEYSASPEIWPLSELHGTDVSIFTLSLVETLVYVPSQ